MKTILLFFVLLICSIDVFSQASNGVVKTAATPGSDEWFDVSKYLWSHAKAKRGDKPPLNYTTLDNWTSLGDYVAISGDGEFLAYALERGTNRNKKLDSIVIQSTDNSWRMAVPKGEPGFFSGDGKQYIFQDQSGLCFLQTGTNSRTYVQDVLSYKLPCVKNDNNEWVAYLLKDKELILRNLVTATEKRFSRVSSYAFDPSGQWLATYTTMESDQKSKELLVYNLRLDKEFRFPNVVDHVFHKAGQSLAFRMEGGREKQISLQFVALPNGQPKVIWSTKEADNKILNYCLDGTGKQVAFMVGNEQPTIWYWREGSSGAVEKMNSEEGKLPTGMVVQSSLACAFTDNNKYIEFYLQRKAVDHSSANNYASQMDLWSYKDLRWQSEQLKNSDRQETFLTAVVHTESGKMIQVVQDFERLVCQQGDYAVVSQSREALYGDKFWSKGYTADSTWVVSLQNGQRRFLTNGNYTIQFSPIGKYLLYFDRQKEASYFSYNLNSNVATNICRGVLSWQLAYIDDMMRVQKKTAQAAVGGIGGWLVEDSAVLVHDNWDIWQLDITGKKKAINITNGYGQKNHIKFKMVKYGVEKDRLLLYAYSDENKRSGYFQKKLGVKGDPELLFMDACYIPKPENHNAAETLPLKAANTSKWIIKRETSTESPNYYLTDDFRNYQQLTCFQEQKSYNWLTSELHSFKQLDGTISQGVLFKPENFDPGKKYPVLIYFYGLLTNHLYKFPEIGYIEAPHFADDPSWMVSHDYLLFCPDSYFYPGGWGPSIINTVDGAARYLSKLSYVDGKHIGAAGHSNSGRSSNYVLSHSRYFASIAVGSGTTSIIAQGLSFTGQGWEWAENSSFGGGLGELWQNKAKWLDHAATLHADKVISPVFQFQPARDRGFEPGAAFEMFNALRRLDKRAWWAEYNKGAHTLISKPDLRDFTIRTTQFFDHYLKTAPAPHWMTNGVPAKVKMVESGFDLDPAGCCTTAGKSICHVCNAWNKQYKRNPAMFEKPISEWKLDDDIQNDLDKKETERHKKDMMGEEQRVKENTIKLKSEMKK